MKTTVKLDTMRAVVIQPDPKGVRLAVTVGSIEVGSFVLGADQIGAVLFGVEQAAEAAGIARARAES
jgi:hypothetical protein